MSDDAAELYRERRIGHRQARMIQPALVIVDLTHGFTDPSSDLGCAAEEAVEQTGHLLAEARAHHVPRVFTRIEYDESSRLIAAPFLEKMPALQTCRVGSWWAQIDQRLAPGPDEPVLSKLFASGFFGTNLSSFLVAHGCDGVIVTGATTSGCVRATVVDAMQHGYRAIVPSRAVTDRAQAPHDAALFDIDAKYGQVTSTEEATVTLRGAHEEVKA